MKTMVEECSRQLKNLLHEQHNALDARVRKQIQEVIEALDKVIAMDNEKNRAAMLLSFSNLLRIATNIADLISRIGND